jgi:heterodisulfide reductase subunit C
LSPILVNKLDSKFRDKIIGQVGGENLRHCLGCGTCSAGCFVREADKRFNPRKIGHMVLLGAKNLPLWS